MMRAVKSQIIQTKVCSHRIAVSCPRIPDNSNTLVISRLTQFVVSDVVSVSYLFCGAGC